VNKPIRILAAANVARRLGVSRPTIAKYLRRELIVPDFTSDGGAFFRVERLPELKETIAVRRQNQWRHMSAAA
jgi:predicted DNA-binding transcriptional regulator AlpA